MMGSLNSLVLLGLLGVLCIGYVAAETQIDAYNFGVFRVRVRDGQQRYELKDIVVAEPQAAPSKKGNTYTHGALRNTVASSEITVSGDKENVIEFSVNGEKSITVTVEEANGNDLNLKVLFHKSTTLYGIPERATDLALRDGVKYRLFTQDIFKYPVPHDQGLYGAIPFLMAHGAEKTSGFFWHNAADSSFQFETVPEGRLATLTSTGGAVDFFVFPGTSPTEVQKQFSSIAGKSYLPPLFSLAYHQCRWNYRSEEDVLQVDENFDKYDIPYDVIWLDIEHTDGKKYFTWDSYNFPHPEQMQDAIASKGRKMVTISDPHIKRHPGYHVFDQASAKGYFVKNTEGTADYEGHCWPGTSSWLDFLNPEVRDWYAELFKYENYKGSTPILYTWIDMNEPAVFNAHEQTFDMNNQHHGGVRHRDVHNIYGYLQTMAAFNGHVVRSSGPPHDTTTRPFVLTRSFFAGTQRYGAVWTGDNAAEWSHLNIATPMLLSLSLSGLVFVGADIGGFFDNPAEDLLVRWYQAAAFTPFFRAHAHLETKRREPWLFGEKNTNMIRAAVANRYKILPYIYTLFFLANQEGTSILKPLFFAYPNDPRTFERQDSFLVGDDLLVRPVVNSGESSVNVFVPGTEDWFNFATGERVPTGEAVPVSCPIEEGIPVLQRAGSILPLRERHRRSSSAQRNDPFTLQIAANAEGFATGSLFQDDTHSFKYQQGSFVHRSFTLQNGKLSSTAFTKQTPYSTVWGHNERFTTSLHIERIRVFGLTKAPNTVFIEYPQGITHSALGLESVTADAIQTRQQLQFSFENNVLTIRRPQALIALDWEITIA